MKILLLAFLTLFLANSKLTKNQLIKNMVKSDRAQFDNMLNGSQIQSHIKDKKTKAQFVKDVEKLNKNFKVSMEKFLDKSFNMKQLTKINSVIESTEYKKFHASLSEKMKQQSAFQMFVQKDGKTKIKKEKLSKINKIDSVIGYTYALELNMNNTIGVVKEQIAKQKGATKEMVEMATAAFKANIKNVSDNAIYFTLNDLDDKKLSKILKMLDTKELKKYFKKMNDLSDGVSKDVMKLVKKYKLGGA